MADENHTLEGELSKEEAKDLTGGTFVSTENTIPTGPRVVARPTCFASGGTENESSFDDAISDLDT